VPDALADQQVLGDLMGRGIDHGDTVGGPQRDERGFGVGGDADPNRLDRFLAHSRNGEFDLGGDRVFRGIDDRNRAADFRGNP